MKKEQQHTHAKASSHERICALVFVCVFLYCPLFITDITMT